MIISFDLVNNNSICRISGVASVVRDGYCSADLIHGHSAAQKKTLMQVCKLLSLVDRSHDF